MSFPGVDLLTLVYAWKRDDQFLGIPVLIFYFNFLKTLHSISHYCCTNLHTPSCTQEPPTSLLHQKLQSFVALWCPFYRCEATAHSSWPHSLLVIRNTDCFLTHPWPFVPLLWRNVYPDLFPTFLIMLFVFWVEQAPYVFWVDSW